ncbi:MAG: hypothetical protein J6V98_05790 [Bacteroidales bacterium]|nr:hypothetical protein [Bacteroidales bacterium]
MRILRTIGNQSLWEREKTLFLSSKLAPVGTWGKVFEWVDGLTAADTVVCFNSSEFENEVLKTLLVNKIPTVLVVMNRFRDTYNVQVEYALNENRLLIIEMQRDEPRGKGATPRLRNQYFISQVQHIVCGYINPNGSIFGLLLGRENVTYLVDRKELRAAEPEPKPCRWTVAEDKRLLRMFYEDMGVHAIHKAIDRPYSTIYLRIKSLTMNDELLKGREFEDYILESLDVQQNDKLALKEWRSDKSIPGVYPENNSAPDFVFDYDGKPFAMECKWRNHMPKDIEKELLPQDRMAIFQQYAIHHHMPVYLILGIGGLPNDPDYLYLSSLDNTFTTETLRNILPLSKESLFAKIESLFSHIEHPNKIEQKRALYPNAYKPWNTDDDDLLERLYNEGTSVKDLMVVFQRNSGGIASRLRKLGLTQ